MSDKSKIQWTEASWNPVVGCSRVSAGCDHCYAMAQARRIEAMHGEKSPYIGTTRMTKRGVDWTGVVKTVPERLNQPLRWKRPRRIFVNSMSDLFHPAVPFEFIDRVFAVMALASRHQFQVLTKRPERMADYLSSQHVGYWLSGAIADIDLERWADEQIRLPLPNVWLGTSVEDQATADERIPHLLRCPAAVRWISAEPLLGPVNIWDTVAQIPIENRDILHWVVVGGESGPGARPCNVAWIRDLVEQCDAAGVPVFVKQLGARPVDWTRTQGVAPGVTSAAYNVRWQLKHSKGGDPDEWPADLRIREYPAVEVPA